MVGPSPRWVAQPKVIYTRHLRRTVNAKNGRVPCALDPRPAPIHRHGASWKPVSGSLLNMLCTSAKGLRSQEWSHGFYTLAKSRLRSALGETKQHYKQARPSRVQIGCHARAKSRIHRGRREEVQARPGYRALGKGFCVALTWSFHDPLCYTTMPGEQTTVTPIPVSLSNAARPHPGPGTCELAISCSCCAVRGGRVRHDALPWTPSLSSLS